MREIFIKTINLYQFWLSPDHSFWAKRRFPYGYCRFYPSCSEYFKLSLKNFGLGKGFLKGLWRILRCNPFAKGGVDPVNPVITPTQRREWHSGPVRTSFNRAGNRVKS